MKVSVIMAVFNTPEDQLREAIESVLNQTMPDFELLIIDDCSTKINVSNIVRTYKDKRIKLFKTPHNSGPAHARNLD